MDSEFYIRQMLPEDLNVAMMLKDAEGWNQTGEDWQLFLTDHPGYCLVAIMNNKPVGTVTAIGYENKLAWVGMMLVDREFRRKGISKRLMREILHRLAGFSTIKLDATPEGQHVYQQMGFKKEYSLWRCVRQAIHSKQVTESDSGISRVVLADLPALQKLDSAIFGANREVVLRHLLTALPEGAFMLKEAGEIQGFLFSRKGSNYTQLGPLVAKNDPIARRLLNQALGYFNNHPLVLDVAANRQKWVSFLESQGFEQRRELIRMYLDTNRCPGMPANYYLIAGPELG